MLPSFLVVKRIMNDFESPNRCSSVTRICPLLLPVCLADGSKTDGAHSPNSGDGVPVYIHFRGQWRQLRIHDHVFTDDGSRAISLATSSMSLLSPSVMSGSNGQYQIFRLIAS